MFDFSSERIRYTSKNAAIFSYGVSAALFLVITVLIVLLPPSFSFPIFLLYLLPVLIVAAVEGLWPAAGFLAASASFSFYVLLAVWHGERSAGWLAAIFLFLGLMLFFYRRYGEFESQHSSSISDFSELNEELNILQSEIDKEKRLSEYLKAKYYNYRRMEKAIEELTATLAPERIYPVITRWANGLAGVFSARAILYLREGEEFKAVAVHPLPVGESRIDSYQWRGSDYLPYVMKSRKNILITDTEKEYRMTPIEKVDRMVRSVILLPLLEEGEIHGVLRLESERPESFGTDELRLLDAFMVPLGITLQNSELYQQTERLAMVDGLTGLYKRHVFNERIESEVKRSLRYNHPTGLLMIDIDHFKRINDSYGHAVGDVVLAHVASILRSEEKGGMLAARYGGEEFAFVVPHQDEEALEKFAERLRTRVEQERSSKVPPDVSVTISIGGAICPIHARSALNLIEAADSALYQAKRAGRNRVVLLDRGSQP